MTKPTEGAVRAAAKILNSEQDEGHPDRNTSVTEIIDREAAAPAVRELMEALRYAHLHASDAVRAEMHPIMLKYRHLIQDSDKESAA